jgi:ethanolamine utilization protein EutA
MHDLDEEHEHPDFADIGPDAVVEDIEGLEMFTLKSVGIDIGSSTSHLVFSQLTLRRQGASLSGRFKVTDRKVLFRSPIMLTPYLSGILIDVEKVKRFIEHAYRAARLQPEDIDTGAVIITGEALKKENLRFRRRRCLEDRAQDGPQCGHGRGHDEILAHQARRRDANRCDQHRRPVDRL